MPAPSADEPVRPRGAAELEAILDWWEHHARDLPWRRTRDVYAVWVAEVMSVQTTVGRAAAAWTRWIERWPTVEDLAAASLRDVLMQWQGLGYPRRARDLHRGAALVVTSGWPEDLTELPGVGSYVAAAIRCFALEHPVLPLDVNIKRVLARRFPDGVDIGADPWRAGQALMEFGQRICGSRPTCPECPVRDGCPGPGAGPAQPARPHRPYKGSVRQRRGRLLARVLAEGAVPVETVDREVAAGLAEDGLATLADGCLIAPR
jgi:A/G-specific adenine glycosylase